MYIATLYCIVGISFNFRLLLWDCCNVYLFVLEWHLLFDLLVCRYGGIYVEESFALQFVFVFGV